MSKPISLLSPVESLVSDLNFNAGHLFALSTGAKVEKKNIYHGVKCGELNFLVSEGILGEVIEKPEICSIPYASESLVGMCSLRGNIVPVFNLHRLLGMESNLRMNRVLVLGESSNRIGFQIEQLPKKILLNSEERVTRLPPLPEVILPFIKHCFFRDSIWIDWDIFGFFTKVSKQV